MQKNEANRLESAKFLRNALIGFCVIFLMTYKAIVNRYDNDYFFHTTWALELSRYNIVDWFINTIPYPLWHLGVKICVDILEISAEKATALVTALYQGAAFLSILAIWSLIKSINIERSKQVFWAVCLLIVNPLYAPWFNQNYYLGQIPPNALHNPTVIAAKCFTILSFGLIVALLQNREDKSDSEKSNNMYLYIALSVALLLSALAKPSFLQGFIPGVGLFIIVRLILERKNFNLKFYLKLCIAFVPAATILLFQYLITFFNADSMREGIYIKIAWGNFFHKYTDNLFISFLLSFAFPLFVLCMNLKKLLRSEKVQLMISYEVVAYLESVLLCEAGVAGDAGDFTWGGMLSALIVWIMMLECYIQELYDVHEEGTLRRRFLIYGGLILFAAHLVFGIVYWYNFIYHKGIM
ncbi:MAG: hypothetical protein NC313_14810 [Butyrivibrio sp.]|nr:hypothetical protein [Butyrivibrio sp.]